VLSDVLGLDDQQIDALYAAGVLTAHNLNS
jgi:hypothetical protein